MVSPRPALSLVVSLSLSKAERGLLLRSQAWMHPSPRTGEGRNPCAYVVDGRGRVVPLWTVFSLPVALPTQRTLPSQRPAS